MSRGDDGGTHLVLFDDDGRPVREEGTMRGLGDALRDLMWVPDEEAARLESVLGEEFAPPARRGSALFTAAPWATVVAWAVVGAIVALVAAWVVSRLA